MVPRATLPRVAACATASATIAATAGSGSRRTRQVQDLGVGVEQLVRLGVDREHRVRELLAVLTR